MPTTFEDREQGIEARFAREEELRFLLLARRDKLFARWAATQLGLPDDEADRLTTAVLAIAGGPDHDQAVLQHIAGLLSADRVAALPEPLPAVLAQCHEQARQQVKAVPPGRSDVF